MTYCSKCGRRLEKNDKFCPGCGERITGNSTAGEASPVGGRPLNGNTQINHNMHNVRNSGVRKADQNSVKYVYVNKKTGKITNNPRVKTGSEGCLQYAVIALSAVAIVIIMVAGSVWLADSLSEKNNFIDSYDGSADVMSEDEVSSLESNSEISSEEVSSETVSSRNEVSSEPQIPEESTAKFLNAKLTGKWSTEVPYKNMNLPGVFEFDGKGKAKCTIKAFLFSKKFDGTYSITDGGQCVLTLSGLEEYFEGDTLVGNLKYITDDSMKFTVDDTVWNLNRME